MRSAGFISLRFEKSALVEGITWNRDIDVDKAIPACTSAIADFSNEARFNYQLGRAYESDGQHTKAIKWYRNAAELDHSLAQGQLGHAFEKGEGTEPNLQKAQPGT